MSAAAYRLSLAPLAGYSEAAFRRVCSEYGACETVTEMVSVNAMAFDNPKTVALMRPFEGENVRVQLFGTEPKLFANAIEKAQIKRVDVNMGCPMPKITKTGAGSKLLCDEVRAAEIVAACVAVGAETTVKMRIGYDKTVSDGFIPSIERAGAAAITIHGRYCYQRYSGESDYETIYRLAEGATVPIFGNGDIATKEDIVARCIPPLSGLAIGRGALANPAIFALEESGLESYLKFLRYLPLYHNERYCMLAARKHATYCVHDKKLRLAIYAATFDETVKLIEEKVNGG